MKHIKRIPIFVRTAIISDKQFDCPYTKPYGYIYKITNQINGHYYIGKHEFHHPWLDKRYKGSGKLLWKAYKKYGIENFETIILEWTDKDNEELNRLEKLYISIFHANEIPNYNLTEGGDGMTTEGPLIFYRSDLGLKKKQDQSEMMKVKNPMNNPSSVEKIRAKLIGKPLSDEAKKKMSENHADFRGSNNPMYGVSLNGEKNGRARSIIRIDPISKETLQYSYMKAVELDGFNVHIVRDCCKGRREGYKGFKWMYKEDYEKLRN